MAAITYQTKDQQLTADEFITLAQKTWPGNYDASRVNDALEKTINITARDQTQLIGCVRILSDGYFFGTIPEILVAPEYQGQGIGQELMKLAWEASETSLFFGAQPGKEAFYESLGYTQSLTSYSRQKPKQSA